MSKLIVDMEMPRNCDECEVNYDCAFCGITGSAFYGNTQIPNFMPDEQKLPDCPIKGVLPDEHGDLVDRDILLQTFQNADYETYNDYCEAFDTVEAAETVIAAERKDDENH